MAMTLFPEEVLELARGLLEAARARGVTVATAESCTGGLVAGALTEIPGSSDVVDRGFVTYTNEAKRDLLGVDADLIAQMGAVSAEVAAQMAEGAWENSGAGLTLSVTGVAGPGGGTPDKPVGTVWFGCAREGLPTVTELHRFEGNRTAVRILSVMTALDLGRRRLSRAPPAP